MSRRKPSRPQNPEASPLIHNHTLDSPATPSKPKRQDHPVTLGNGSAESVWLDIFADIIAKEVVDGKEQESPN